VGKILIPATAPSDWQQLLAEPKKHWKRGYSAHALAHCWHETNDFPKAVRKVFTAAGPFKNLELLLAIPEHQVPMPPFRGYASQNDLWVLARCATSLISIAVEGKVAEPFGPTVREWLSNPTPGKITRLDFLCKLLDVGATLREDIRYQLLHRTGSALIEAKRFLARHAVVLVHSFSQSDVWFDDFVKFVGMFGVEGVRDKVVTAREVEGIKLHFAWIRGEEKYLNE
jgi:hypothetical protein